MAVRGALQWSEWTSCSWSAGGSGQVRQRPGNNNHKPICWPETAWPKGPRHAALRMELIAPTRAPHSTQARRAPDTRPHAPILCLFLILCWNNVNAAGLLLWRLYTRGERGRVCSYGHFCPWGPFLSNEHIVVFYPCTRSWFLNLKSFFNDMK